MASLREKVDVELENIIFSISPFFYTRLWILIR